MENLPIHLKKYIVDQDDYHYTSKEHAVWRHILRQLRHFLKNHAHESYLDGLEKTGISTEEIPKIKDISAHIEKFGWRALPVSGFIPPAAFMELQSLSVLPIAAEIRSIDHLNYTPAPDIVHEAAGHAPILINAEFAAYLKKYSQVAKKAILSKEDLDIYEAIRILSDIKEDPASTKEEVTEAEKNLAAKVAQNSFVSEAAELGRMNWWTAEYGLIGDLSSPKIFGAGLLSSVGESKHCLSAQVKKIPLSIECLTYSYDITEPQPQLFVAKSFKHLESVLEEMASRMAYKVGGSEGLKKALQSRTINTVQLNSGLQISGVLESYADISGQVTFLKTVGPTQLCYEDSQLDGHDKNYHTHGYSTPLGKLKGHLKSTFDLSDEDWQVLGLELGKAISLHFDSGFSVEGIYYGRIIKDSKTILMSFRNATVKNKEQIVYQPEWGPFDLALGDHVTSVFAGPADRMKFGINEDFKVKKVKVKSTSDRDLKINLLYSDIRFLRTQFDFKSSPIDKLNATLTQIHELDARDWLLPLEIYEILNFNEPSLKKFPDFLTFKETVYSRLHNLAKEFQELRETIENGLALANQPHV